MRALAVLAIALPLLAQQGQQRGPGKPGIYGRCPGGPALSGPAPRVDPAYSQIANATGGQVFNLRGADLDKIAELVVPRLGDKASILLASGIARDAAPREFTVPVDASSSSVTFSVTVELKCSVELVRPSGAPVQRGEPGIAITEYGSGRQVTVKPPEPGAWRVQVSGYGAYSVAAFAKSELDLASFGFVRPGGRPGHEGLFPIEGMPVVGQEHIGQARMMGPFRSAAFHLISQAGEPIQPFPLAQQDGEEFIGAGDLPQQPFRVAVTGLDATGATYQRVFSGLFRLAALEITPDRRWESVPAGATSTITFVVRNRGPAGTFQVVVTAYPGVVSAPNPAALELGAGAAAAVAVNLAVPDSVQPGASITVTLTATNAADRDASNGISLTLTVAER